MDSEERLLAYWEADRQQSSAQWTKSDLVLDLEDQTLKEFSEHVNDSYQQIRNYKWVAERYPLSVRTDNLSWTHYERIAARDDRLGWLKKAEENHWSVRTMLDEIREHDRAKDDWESWVNRGKMVVAEGRAAFTQLAQGVLANLGDAGLVRFVEDIHVDPDELVLLLEADTFEAYQRAITGRFQ
jgi:hypothetical protein